MYEQSIGNIEKGITKKKSEIFLNLRVFFHAFMSKRIVRIGVSEQCSVRIST